MLNRTKAAGNQNPAYLQSVAVSHPTTPASGDPVRCGNMTGVALTAERADGTTSIDLGPFEASFSVKGVDGAGNSAVALFDKLYYVDADTPVLSKKVTGKFFGYAMETVGSGSTATIRVFHPPASYTQPVAATALTAAEAGAVNTGDAGSDTVITNIRTRVGEIEDVLQALGLLS